MFRKKTSALAVILMVLTTVAIGFVAEATLIQNEEKKYNQSLMFDAVITFTIMTGEGCACTPIEGAIVSAYGGEGNDSAVTDDDGICNLTLVILGEYEVYIEADGYGIIYFEFIVLDDQTFTFHMFEKPENVAQTVPLYQKGYQKMSNNSPPDIPDVDGPKNGVIGKEIEFTVVTTDPDGDDVIYCFNWDDGSGEVCIGPFESGKPVQMSHIWEEPRTYTIKIKAGDIHGAESDNATHLITISKSKILNSFYLQLLQKFPNVFQLLRELIGIK